MSKYKFTALDINQHCEAEMLEKPDFIEITDETVICKWANQPTAITQIDADKLWSSGKGKFWDYDNNPETREEHILVKWDRTGQACTVTLTILRTV